MNNFILIFIFLLLGLVLQNVKQIPKNAHKILNWVVIYICLPALALYYIPKIKWDNQLLFSIGVSWIGFIISYFFFNYLGNKKGWPRKLTGCLIICSGLGNTSFLGFPIIEALYGEEGMKTAIIVDQPGSFVVLSTLAVLVATAYSKGNLNSFQIAKKIAFFPPFVTFCIACLMNVFKFDFYEWGQLLFKSIGSVVTPLALLSVGLQLRFEKRSMHWEFLGLGLFYKLIATPAIIFFLYVIVLNQHSKAIQVAVLESAMAPMITACILSSTYGLKPRLSSMMIGFGIPLSFITLIFWAVLMRFI
ncbi:AEC family transporter [Flavobacterium sp. 5]|uniref:AEC family transporter n=1 Tax=Flavobacterium sp. 5 TaxID=2035199 RepID=UPI000C2BC370|nr:AEC family transporter [Flavobacterium sp. 5]PKB15712.1 hypothetical protein CLU82_0799 [Flavobacterium sp. 5]